MIIVVSGEGPTDIGRCDNGAIACEGSVYVPGAMGRFVDVLVEPIWGYSPLESEAILCLTERELGRLSRRAKITTLPGKKRAQETGYFHKNAYALAKFSQGLEHERKVDTMAVLFRDCDGTRSAQPDLWDQKIRSMSAGFAAAGYQHGVPMVPKPKSEAWLLCAIQKRPYQHCERFEDISGNDSSPKSAKKELETAMIGRGKTFKDAPDMVADRVISPSQINMPSFNAFRDRIEQIAREMVGG